MRGLMAESHLEQIASDLVDRATRAGATAADVVVREADEFSTTVRLGKIESLKEAASKALGLRAFLGARSATAFSSDFSPQSLSRLVERTIAMARVSPRGPRSRGAQGGGAHAAQAGRPQSLHLPRAGSL